MDFKVGAKYHGFTVDRVREDKNAGGVFIEMTHDVTGARLCYSKNDEENKLFSVSFKTIPEDSTGVFHILEHSVLCGSDKYPVKEPFVELLKSSMNTFLNAMTYPDKTVYPVSSRNAKDYLNLAGVYLDAVFAPALLTNENVFLQEGRRLEVTDGVPAYNGVVLNEMRGAMSEADDRLEEGLGALLFPDNCYGFNSGGEPFDIPSLTYEKYVETYRKFYHPSNSYFYLDGDIPEEETFSLIESYLDGFEAIPVEWDVELQTPKSAEKTDRYGSDSEEGAKDILALAKIFADYTMREKIFAVSILANYLASTNESPLKRAILASGLAEDVEVNVSDGIRQPYISIVARNMKRDDADVLRKLIFETLASVRDSGIPEEDITACLNRFEFSFKQMPEPKGLVRNIVALNSWLYGGDPMMYLDVDDVFEKLRSMTGEDYCRLLDEVFCSEEDYVTLHLNASVTLASEVAEKEAGIAKAAYGKLDEEGRAAHAEKDESFRLWQDTPDTPEQVATVPTLPISEVSPDPKDYPTEVRDSGGVKTLIHKIRTNGIVYFTVYAPLTQFSLDELSVLSVLPSLYTQLPTEKHDVTSLQREIKTYLGDLSVSAYSFSEYGQTESATPCLIVSASALEENFGKAQEIVSEVVTSTLFDEKGRILEILKQIEESNRQRIVGAGHTAALSAARATLSADGAVSEAFRGISMMKTVKRLTSSFDDGYGELLTLIRRATTESFTKENVIFSLTAEKEHDLSPLAMTLRSGKALPANGKYASSVAAKTAVKIPSQVSYAVKADLSTRAGVAYDPSFSVAAQIISLEYLWNEIRVRGGAYGAGMSVAPNGTLFAYSYRDPSPASSLGVYDGCAKFIEDFASGCDSIDKYIISAISEGDPLQTPRSQGSSADALYLTGVTYEERKRRRAKMLSTGKDDLVRFASVLRHMATDGTVSVVASSGVDPIEGLETIEI